MFFWSLSLIFQSACSTSSDFLAPSLVSPAQQCGAGQVTLQGGAFQFRLLYGGRAGAGSCGQEGGGRGKILVRFFSPQGAAGAGAQWPQPAWQLPSPRVGFPCSKPPWTPSRAVQLSQPQQFWLFQHHWGVPVPRASGAALAAPAPTLSARLSSAVPPFMSCPPNAIEASVPLYRTAAFTCSLLRVLQAFPAGTPWLQGAAESSKSALQRWREH